MIYFSTSLDCLFSSPNILALSCLEFSTWNTFPLDLLWIFFKVKFLWVVLPHSLWHKFLTCVWEGWFPTPWPTPGRLKLPTWTMRKKDLLFSMCFLVTTRNKWFCVSIYSIYVSCSYATVLGGNVVFALRLQSSWQELRHFKITTSVCGSGCWIRKCELSRRWEWGSEGDRSDSPKGPRAGADSDVTAARRFRSPAPERMTSPSVGPEPGSPRPPGAHDRAVTAGESASTSVPPTPGTMATDSWALAVDEQEAAAESVSCLQP